MNALYIALAVAAGILITIFLRKPVIRLALKGLIWLAKKADKGTGELHDAIVAGEKALEEDLNKVG